MVSVLGAGAAKHKLSSSTVCPGDMELRLKMKRDGEDGRLALVKWDRGAVSREDRG